MQTETNYTSKEFELAKPYFESITDFKDYSTPWSGHKFFGYNLVKNLAPQLVVELGTWRGSSFYAFCQAAKDNKLNSRLVAIDTWQGDKHAGMYDDRIFVNFVAILKKHYASVNAEYLREDFMTAVGKFEDNSIDILHIDGLHTYEAVSNDFDTWLPKVKKDGIILFHDVAEKMSDFGVWRLWSELKSKYPYTLEFSHSHGLGILFRDEEKYKIVADTFLNTKIECLEFVYQATKAELFEANYQVKELGEIKESKYWKLKESLKKILK